MCGTLSWTLAVVNGGNVGENRDVRETQLIFKAPHPMNLVAPHLMVELRSAGFIEICGDLEEEHGDILETLDGYFADRFVAERIDGHEDFCDRYYQAGEDVFKGNSGSLESNFGLLCTNVCDMITQWEGWSLVACNASNYGADGRHSEQQMIFRRDYHPLGDSKYLQVILNALGNIEVNGKHVKEIHSKLDGFLRKKWGCERAGHFSEGEGDQKTICRRYTWDVEDLNMLRATADVVTFFELQGRHLVPRAAAPVPPRTDRGDALSTDRDRTEDAKSSALAFGMLTVGTVEPHVFVEFYAGEGDPEFFNNEEHTQVLANQNLGPIGVMSMAPPSQSQDIPRQKIRIRGIGPGSEKGRMSPELESVVEELEFQTFVVDYLGGEKDEDCDGLGEDVYHCNVFLCRGKFENNLAQWTMRLCDWMVDRLGWSFIVSSLCNMGDFGQNRLQQVIFRFDGDKRALPVSKSVNPMMESLDPANFPEYWEFEEVGFVERKKALLYRDEWTHVNSGFVKRVLEQREVQRVKACKPDEKAALQELMDHTFKRVLTRDRVPDDDAEDDEEMPYRLEVVHAFRSEHACWSLRSAPERAFAELRMGHGTGLNAMLCDAEMDKEAGEMDSTWEPLSHGAPGKSRDDIEATQALAEDFETKTSTLETLLSGRLKPGEAYLYHGTNPSSAMSILKTGFVLDHAGSATGTMYGAGIYMAECSSKSDEYGRDDGGNTYPSLHAMLVGHLPELNPDRGREASTV
ncbi:Hypothetical protein SCF082_LOCUS28131 [Durusdinium trenchii]|uniref:Poly [ADP-ribose] polymerase n=1 Tax=Durusdinium trenchii TaxID=1381693 RepID=A0ABP0MI95_9DINO